MSRSGVQPSMTAKEIQNMLDDDDSSSTSTVSSYGSSDDGYDDDDTIESSDSEQEGLVNRIEEYAIQGNTPALAQMVFEADFRLPGSKKNKRTSNSSVASLRSTVTLTEYEAPATINSTNLLTPEEIAKMLLISRPTPQPKKATPSSNGSGATMKRSFSENGLGNKGFISVGPSMSSDNVSLSSRKSTASSKPTGISMDMKPWDFLGEIMKDQGLPHVAVPYTQVADGFFMKYKRKHFDAYDSEIARATRVGDLDAVKNRYQSGRTLLSCNRFKESIIHTICRRGHVRLLRYIIDETNISIKLVDDIGRNPIHDACWTHKPNFDLIKLLITAYPDLLYIADNRGFTPLDYIGKGCWHQWCKFLYHNRDSLAPRELFADEGVAF